MSGRAARTNTSVAKPSGDRDSGQPATSGNDAAGDKQSKAVPLPVEKPTGQDKTAVAESKAQTEQPDPYKLRDLNAQEDMAYWAMWMFVAALLTFFVTSVGTFLIWRQVKLTRQAVEDTSEATEAMREANEIARDTAKRQLRAYIHLKSADLCLCAKSKFPTENGNPEQRFADVEIQNYGLTPARNLVSVCGVGIRPFPPTDHKQPIGPIPDWVERAVSELPPGRESGLPLEITNSGDLHERLLKGELAVYFYAEVSYEDVFGEKHETRISLISHGISYKRGSFYVAKEGNHSN